MTTARWLTLGCLAVFSACTQQTPSLEPAATAAPVPPAAVTPSAPASSSGTGTPTTAAPASPEALYVYFNRGTATLTTEAESVLDHAARLYREGHPSVMLVAGHADQTGQELPNLLLSARRADAVKRGLAARGLPPETVRM
jgi:outer membrane protein OmpA-like peptidoglycan-associated protein